METLVLKMINREIVHSDLKIHGNFVLFTNFIIWIKDKYINNKTVE